jgi:hypothetical protein
MQKQAKVFKAFGRIKREENRDLLIGCAIGPSNVQRRMCLALSLGARPPNFLCAGLNSSTIYIVNTHRGS